MWDFYTSLQLAVAGERLVGVSALTRELGRQHTDHANRWAAFLHQGGREGCAEEIIKKHHNLTCTGLAGPDNDSWVLWPWLWPGQPSAKQQTTWVSVRRTLACPPAPSGRRASPGRLSLRSGTVADCLVFLLELRWEVLSVPATRRLVPAGEHEVEPSGSG